MVDLAPPPLARRALRIAACILAVAGGASSVRAQSTFSLGSTAAEVRRAQGVPNVIERLRSLGVEIWTYGAATVRFSSDSLRVMGWDNAGRTLRVRLRPGADTTSARAFGVGSHGDDVIRLLGTPVGVREDRTRGTMRWRYGASSITIALSDGRVLDWVDAGNLPVASGRRGIAVVAKDGLPNAPPTLDAELLFSEPSGNRALDGGETAVVLIAVRNRGSGPAFDVQSLITIDSSSRPLEVGRANSIARLDAGATAEVRVPVAAPLDVDDGRTTLRLHVTERHGFDLEQPHRLTFDTRAARPPRFAIAGVRTDDQSGDGRISARELVEVTARVWNEGQGVAREVRATIDPGPDCFLVKESARQVTLGSLAPGEHRDVTFVFYTNTRARRAHIALALVEATGRFGATLTLPFELDRAVPQTLALTTVTSDTTAPLTSPPSVLDEVERDIPRAVGANPDAIAVVIGVERYGSLPPADFAARDAQLFRRYAVSALGAREDRGRVYVRTDADATGNELRKVFADDGWLARRVTPSSDVYVFFSGHAATDAKSGTSYLLPTDGDATYPSETGFAFSTLFAQLARLDVRSVTVFLDACCTAATRASGLLPRGNGPIIVSVEHPALLRDNFAVFAATATTQTASDLGDKRYGMLTYFAMMGLRGAADSDGDSTVSVGELERYLADHVGAAAASLNREQTPVVVARDKTRILIRLGGTR